MVTSTAKDRIIKRNQEQLYKNNMESVFVLRLTSIGVSGQFELGQGLRQGSHWMVNIVSEKNKNFKIIT